ncbi:hypothetical protein ACFL59_10155 [Planctomycetota bacterium]
MRVARVAVALVFAVGVLISVGCRFPIVAPVVVFTPVKPEPGRLRIKTRNELRVGIRELKPSEPGSDQAALAERVGSLFATEVIEARLFREVYYPHAKEEVDVILEPQLTVAVDKNRGTNAIKGFLFPICWIKNLGLKYDFQAEFGVRVLNSRKDGALCESMVATSTMTAERAPPILYVIGIHAEAIVVGICELFVTDQLVLQELMDQAVARAVRPVLEKIVYEFEPEPKPCPDHPDVKQPGRYCIFCRRDLYHQILSRGEAAPKKKPRGKKKGSKPAM